jgi:heme-degrading monooxygenase HmoA
MYARMTIAQAQPERFDEALAAVRDAFAPAAREQPGYAGFLLLADRSQHQLVGISLWESEADLQRSGGVSGYYQERMRAFADLVVSFPSTTTHEVVIHEP